MATVQIIGSSKPVVQMLELIRKVASSKTNVLILGESGTGKELVARMIHEKSPLAPKPFVPVNCGAIPENLIESEMFGHKRGSFTGAVSDKMGLFEAAHGGTLFLDEIGELPLSMQVKLLRALQERIIRKVGGNEDIKVDVRIIAATNRDLETLAKQGKFREDLFYRLNVIQILTPALRDRKGDLPQLIEHFIEKLSKKQGKSGLTLSAEGRTALERHSWPGNIRELENALERSVTMTPSGEIPRSALPDVFQGEGEGTAASSSSASSSREIPFFLRLEAPDFSKGPKSLASLINSAEKMFLQHALDATQNNPSEAARHLQISEEVLLQKLKQHGILPS